MSTLAIFQLYHGMNKLNMGLFFWNLNHWQYQKKSW